MPVPVEIRTALFIRDKWCCRACKWRNELDPHHLTYRSHGGEDTLENLISLCRQCHDAHHAGKLIIHLTAEGGNGIIRFERVNGWRPK